MTTLLQLGVVIHFYLTPIMPCDAIYKINHDPLDDKTRFPNSYPKESTG